MARLNPFDSDDTDDDSNKNSIQPTNFADKYERLDVAIPEDPEKKEMKIVNGQKVEYSFEAEDGEIYAGEWVRDIFKSKSENIVLGTVKALDETVPAKVPLDIDTILHLATFGRTGSGKTTYVQNAMVQLAEKGKGFTFVDPKGDGDILELMRMLPPERWEDVVYLQLEPMDGHSVGINPLYIPNSIERGTEEYESVIGYQEELLTNVLMEAMDDMNFGGTMTDVLSAMFTAMSRSEENYTFADVHVLLTNPDSLELFIEKMEREFEDEFNINDIRRLQNYDEKQLETLTKRTANIIRNKSVRDFLVNEKTDLDFKEILEDNKILLVDASVDDKGAQVVIMGYVINSMYVTAKQNNIDDMHILFADEFDKVLETGVCPLESILKRGRSSNFSLWYITQNPSTLRDGKNNFMREAQNNTGVIASGVIHEDEASRIKGMFTEPYNEKIDKQSLSQPGRFKFWLEIPDPNPSEPVAARKVRGFPPFPPRISEEDSIELLAKSMKEYGSPHTHIVKYRDGVRPYLTDDERMLTQDELVEAVDVARIFDTEHGKTPYDGYATKKTIERVIEHATGTATDSINIEEELESAYGHDYLEKKKQGDAVYYKVSREGKEEFNYGTGTSGSAGGEAHRLMTQDIRKTMAKYGIAVTLPTQAGSDDKADAIATVFASRPDRPFSDELSIGDTFPIEIEKSTTDDKPARMCKNFRKAFENGEFVVFATDPKPPSDNSSERYEKIESIFNRGFTRESTQYGERLYTVGSLKRDGIYPLRKLPAPDATGTRSNKWYISPDRDKLRLMEKSDSGALIDISTWNPVESFENWSKTDFPAYAERIKNENGDYKYIIHDLETNREIGPVNDVKETDKYRQVHEPWVPQIQFNGDMPTRGDFGILVIPNRGHTVDKPQIYYNESFYNLGESPFSTSYSESQDAVETESEDNGEYSTLNGDSTGGADETTDADGDESDGKEMTDDDTEDDDSDIASIF